MAELVLVDGKSLLKTNSSQTVEFQISLPQNKLMKYISPMYIVKWTQKRFLKMLVKWRLQFSRDFIGSFSSKICSFWSFWPNLITFVRTVIILSFITWQNHRFSIGKYVMVFFCSLWIKVPTLGNLCAKTQRKGLIFFSFL